MVKFNWCTDLHLDRVEKSVAEQFFHTLSELKDPLLISGDISEGEHLKKHLDKIEASLKVPFYFVLGNHDYWGSSLAAVKKSMQNRPYLPDYAPISLTNNTALIGHDGWADGRVGDFLGTDVILNDFNYIQDFLPLTKKQQLDAIHKLGDEAALFLNKQLKLVFTTHQEALLVTHIPPYEKSAFFKGGHSDPRWSCYMVCRAVGEMLEKTLRSYPNKRCTVLCGHSHHSAEVDILPNLKVIVGPAEYGHPTLQPPLEVK